MQRIGSHRSCPYKKEKLAKLKINYFLGSTGELSLQANHHLKIWRDRWTHRITAEICLLEGEDARDIIEMSMNSMRVRNFGGFSSYGDTTVSRGPQAQFGSEDKNNQSNIIPLVGKGEFQSLLTCNLSAVHDKGLFSREKVLQAAHCS